MANNYFKFKQFTILQEKSAMKVGTDGVLLGAWANIENTKSILDIGTGTGLIALMLAQRCNAIVDAIEIDKAAFSEAYCNTEQCPWSERISIHHNSLQEYALNSKNKYDLIVSNPPFFDNSLKADKECRTTARHTYTLSTKELFTSIITLMKKNGIFSVIIPNDKLQQYKLEAENNNLYCNSIVYIKPTPEKPPKRVLIEFSQEKNKFTEDSLIVEEFGRHQYSYKYKQLTKEFYLAF